LKKIIYTLLAITLVFSACKKEDDDTVNPPTNTSVFGCTDITAINYNILATIDTGSCIYDPRVYVPDDNFEQHLINIGKDDVMDNYVELDSITSIDTLIVNNKNITDLTGIDYFYSLEILNCENNQLSELYLPYSVANLKIVNCSNNQITSLDVSECAYVEQVKCNNNQLTYLNIRTGPNWFPLSFVDVRNNPNLTCIQVDDVGYAEDEVDLGNWNIDSHHYFSTNCPQ